MSEIVKKTVTLKDLFEKLESVKKVANLQGLPVKTAYRLGKLVKQIQNELMDADGERNKLIEKHGEKTKSGYHEVKEENLKAYNDEWNELIKEEVELSFIHVPLTDIPKGTLSPLDIMNLEDFFTPDSIEKVLAETEGQK